MAPAFVKHGDIVSYFSPVYPKLWPFNNYYFHKIYVYNANKYKSKIGCDSDLSVYKYTIIHCFLKTTRYSKYTRVTEEKYRIAQLE